ncbi:MAG: hypothetical protein A2V93_11565 [Ignavibacteria bacterium RBG_16_34_14]|nr:MAG: hypothetical protein A2V93_11565 [Ignavibacteria bacterium RBG_16_34_14]
MNLIIIKKSFLIVVFLLLIVVMLSLNLGSQDISGQLLKSIQNKFQTINDLTVDVIQKSGGKEVLSGKLSYKKENRFHLDLKNNLIVSDGSTIWNFNKKENKVIINNVDESDPSFFSFSRIIYDYPDHCYLTSEQNGEVLVLTPKENSDLNFSKAKLWISKDNLINKIILEGISAENIEVSFSNYKLNQNLEDLKFRFSPPEGSSIIDLR